MNLQQVFSFFEGQTVRRWFGLFGRSRPVSREKEQPPEAAVFPSPPVSTAAVEEPPPPVPPAAGGESIGGEPISDEAPAAVVALPDPALEALRAQAVALKGRIADLSARRLEMEQLVERFEYAQYQALGERLVENLRLRHQYLGLQASRSGRAEDLEAEREAAAELEAYRQVREEGSRREVPTLADDDRDDLKRLYRAVVMRCHPDRVGEEEKAAAHDFFIRTQAAYRQNDLDALRLIHRQLAEGASFEDGAAGGAGGKALEQLIQDLQDQAADLILAIQTMQLDDVYRKARRIDDWDDYFASVRELLDADSRNLKQKIRALSKS